MHLSLHARLLCSSTTRSRFPSRYGRLLRLGLGAGVLAVALLVLALRLGRFALVLGAFAGVGLVMVPLLPIMLECAVEHTFPAAEEISTGLLFAGSNVVGVAMTCARARARRARGSSTRRRDPSRTRHIAAAQVRVRRRHPPRAARRVPTRVDLHLRGDARHGGRRRALQGRAPPPRSRARRAGRNEAGRGRIRAARGMTLYRPGVT